jgi:glucokinase
VVQRTTEPHAIGIDVGGTKVAAGVVDLALGSVVRRTELPTRPERGGPAVLDDVVELATGMAAELGSEIRIGVAVCEVVTPDGEITSAQTLEWRGIDVVGALAGVGSAVVASDVRAAAAAEARYGAGRGHDPFLYLSVGTGVSSTLVRSGEPYAGRHGSALVAASGTFATVCPHCGRDIELVPEAIASGLGMASRYAAGSGRAAEGAESVLKAAVSGDALAQGIVDEGGAMLGTIASWLVNVLDPAAIVLGGGLGLVHGRYRDRFLERLREHVWPAPSADLPVVDAALGADAAIVGAAMAAAGIVGEDR